MAKHNIKELTDYLHIRKRTEMYLGSRDNHTQQLVEFDGETSSLEEMTWTPALYTGFREILDNASDELIGHGHGNRIDVTYDEKTLVFSVKDNGRGIPIDYDSEKNEHLATMVLTRPRTGRNFEERGNVAGTNGIGSKATSNTAEWMDVEIVRDGKKFTQRFEEDLKGNELVIHDPILVPSKEKTGTSITYKPSKTVYHSTTLPLGFVKSRIIEFAAINSGIKVYFNGELIKTKPSIGKTLFGKLEGFSIRIDDEDTEFHTEFLIVPNFTETEEHYQSVVNNILAFEGGTHMDAFRLGFSRGLISALSKESKRRKLTPNRSDVMERLLVFNVTQMKSPTFGSQSKTRLVTEHAGKIVQKYLSNDEVFKDIIKKNKDWINEVYQRCEERTHKKDASELAKKVKKSTKVKVPDLMDATGKDRSKCVLLLTEGLSAAGGCASVRDPDIHGALPLRGKVMNVNGEKPTKVIESKALIDIMNSLGLVIGQKADRKTLRYGKIFIATDMDEDGKNIMALLVNFFNTYWPELFDSKDNPVVFHFMTPFVKAQKGKVVKYWYQNNYHEFKPEDYSGWSITRAKGLGSLEKDDWKHAMKNPVVVPIIDDGELTESLDLIFNGTRADDRKEWMGL